MEISGNVAPNAEYIDHLRSVTNTELQKLLQDIAPQMTLIVDDYNRHTAVGILTFYFHGQTGDQAKGGDLHDEEASDRSRAVGE